MQWIWTKEEKETESATCAESEAIWPKPLGKIEEREGSRNITRVSKRQ